MKLIITEKPSVAQTIAKVLGITQRKDGYLENEDYLISWCVGHLISLAPPKSYDDTFSKWSYDQLPIFPTTWQWETIQQTKHQFNILAKLMTDTRVDSLICATDAGREGELIFRLVYHQANCQKPFERLWVSSMEDQSILDAFNQLTPSQDYDALFTSALCRSKADWLVGMNATRLFSVLYGQTLNVGRVQSPTLSMVVERVDSIQQFQKEKYFAVHLKTDQFTAISQKITSELEAQTIQKACHNQQMIVRKIEAKEKNISPPKLYDLTSLQREANRFFDYTAQQTLDYAQSLYEKKVITYPRTDSKFVTDDMVPTVQTLADKIIERFSFSSVISHQPTISLIVNNKKVSDHHGLLPTLELFNYDLDTIPSTEKNILLLIIKRLLTATGQKHTVEEVTVFLECYEYPFSVKGKTIKFSGWKEIDAYATTQFFNQQKKKKELAPLPPLSVDQSFKTQASIATLFSSPPKYFTEDSLLSAMENAGNDYDSEDSEDIEKKGLGTPAKLVQLSLKN
nr:DNA topoisomerase [Enterococcus plantarum]